MDLKNNQVNGSHFGSMELLHEKLGLTPPHINQTHAPIRVLSIDNSSCVSPKVVLPILSLTVEVHVKQMIVIKV
jgi:hypothetical protein